MEHICRNMGGASLLYAWFEAMHTRIDLLLYHLDFSERELLLLADGIQEEVVRIEAFGSRFLPCSEVSAVNTSIPGEWTNVSVELLQIIIDCMDYAVKTDGLFDITASPESRGISLSEKLEVDVNRCAVRRLSESVRIDLSGYLKGYALGRCVNLLRKGGINDALLSFGNSSVYGMGNHPCGDGWPVSTKFCPEKVYRLCNTCLTTSGNYAEGRMHIVHPLTGELIGGKKEVSVLTDRPEEGEVMSIVRFLQQYGSSPSVSK